MLHLMELEVTSAESSSKVLFQGLCFDSAKKVLSLSVKARDHVNVLPTWTDGRLALVPEGFSLSLLFSHFLLYLWTSLMYLQLK